MKYIIASILLFFTTHLYSQENSSLTILCPENWTISLNGYVQGGTGTKRVLRFYYPENTYGETNLIAFIDGENVVLHKVKIGLVGGKNTTIDIRPKEQVQAKPKINFNIFEKSQQKSIAKPDFNCIMKKDYKTDVKIVMDNVECLPST